MPFKPTFTLLLTLGIRLLEYLIFKAELGELDKESETDEKIRYFLDHPTPDNDLACRVCIAQRERRREAKRIGAA